MEVDTKGMYEIGQHGKEIRIIYTTEADASIAMMKLHRKVAEEISKLFPNGIF